MEKIFYTDKTSFPSSEAALRHVLSTYFKIENAIIVRNEHGKPYLENADDIPLHFSVSHTKKHLFIAFSDENVGVDAEPFNREVPHYPSISRRFITEEQDEIHDVHDFLVHWAIKESVVKWLGGSLAHDLKEIAYVNGQIHYGVFDLHVIPTIFNFNGVLICVCSENDFSNAEFIPF